MFKVNNRNTGTRCEICSKLIIKIPERRSGIFIVHFEHISHLACSKLTIKIPECRSGVFIVNFEHISHFVLVFLLLTLSR